MFSGNEPTEPLMAWWEEKIARVEEEKAYLEMEKDREINQKTALLSDLRRQRNSILPISRLPSEILAIIFIHGAHDYHENDRTGCNSCIPAWVNVSYVCSRWRKIALGCPTLWTYHFNVSLRWTEELVLRSKQSPLKISCHYQRPRRERAWWLDFVDNLLKHSARIQEFHLNLLPEMLPDELSIYAPLLEDLEIDLYEQPDWPLAITAGYTPLLRTLMLSRCPLPWYSLNLSRLNSLSLHRASVPGLNMPDFLALLSSMQDLTVLVLEYVLPGARGFLSSGGLGDSPKIELPRLALLAVTVPLSTVTALLSSINIPFKTRLRLEPLFEPQSSIGDYAPISSFLSGEFSTSEQPSSSRPISRSLLVCAGYDSELIVSSLEHDYHPDSQPVEKLGRNIPLRIAFEREDEETEETVEMTEYEKQCIISGICCSLPSINIQTLHVVDPGAFPSFVWKAMFSHLDGLRYMKLSYGWMPDLSILSLTVDGPEENLDGMPTHDQNPVPGHALVPALEELELFRIVFIPDDASPKESHMSQKSLFDALSTRQGLRDRLTMIECEVVGR